ncbi:hypothetical protein H6792_03035 [Candidatus Nomurabacteria bacterium]|nr:hypothetical protein [Candidatus Nomurabacteria bacterium]
MSGLELETGEYGEYKDQRVEKFIGGLFAQGGVNEGFVYDSLVSSFGKEEDDIWYGVFWTEQELLSFLYGVVHQKDAANDLVITGLRFSSEEIIINFKTKKKDQAGLSAILIDEKDSEALFTQVFNDKTSETTGLFPARYRLGAGIDQVFVRTHQGSADI